MFKDSYYEKDIFREKKKSSRLRFWLWSGISLILGLALVGALYLVIYSGNLDVKKLSIKDSELVSQDEILNSLSNQMLEGKILRAILGSQNILFWGLGEKPSRLNNLPILGSLGVNVNLLKREVNIYTKERDLFGVLCRRDNICYGFDEEGSIFTEVANVQGTLILKIEDLNERPIILGKPLLGREDWIKNIFMTLKTVQKSSWGIDAVKIKDLNLEEWEIATLVGPSLHFSLNFVPDDLENILKNLEKRLNFGKVKYLDFRVQNRIYYK